MNIITIKIGGSPIDSTLSDSCFSIHGGDWHCGEWRFYCAVEMSAEDNDADLWKHTFSADIYQQGYGSYVADGPKVWAKSAVAYVTGGEKALDLHTALRPFLFECVVDAFVAGYHIDGSYRHDGREWNLNCIDTPDTLELPDLMS